MTMGVGRRRHGDMTGAVLILSTDWRLNNAGPGHLEQCVGDLKGWRVHGVEGFLGVLAALLLLPLILHSHLARRVFA